MTLTKAVFFTEEVSGVPDKDRSPVAPGMTRVLDKSENRGGSPSTSALMKALQSVVEGFER